MRPCLPHKTELGTATGILSGLGLLATSQMTRLLINEYPDGDAVLALEAVELYSCSDTFWLPDLVSQYLLSAV